MVVMVVMVLVVVPGERVDSIRYQHYEPYGRPVWRCSSSSVPATLGRTTASSVIPWYWHSQTQWQHPASQPVRHEDGQGKSFSASFLAQISVEKPPLYFPHWIVKSDRSYSLSSLQSPPDHIFHQSTIKFGEILSDHDSSTRQMGVVWCLCCGWWSFAKTHANLSSDQSHIVYNRWYCYANNHRHQLCSPAINSCLKEAEGGEINKIIESRQGWVRHFSLPAYFIK